MVLVANQCVERNRGHVCFVDVVLDPAIFDDSNNSLGRSLATEEQTFFVAVLTVVTWIVATYLTPPESNETLVQFFRKTRPSYLGWGPISKIVPEVVPDRDLGWRVLASVVGSVTIFLLLQCVGDWIFSNYPRALLLTLLAGLAIWLTMRLLQKSHLKQYSQQNHRRLQVSLSVFTPIRPNSTHGKHRCLTKQSVGC